jgi:hypothetical protein
MDTEIKQKRKYTRKIKKDFTIFLKEDVEKENMDIYEKYPDIKNIENDELKMKIINVLNGIF